MRIRGQDSIVVTERHRTPSPVTPRSLRVDDGGSCFRVVNVVDGRLTITRPGGMANHALAYVEITDSAAHNGTTVVAPAAVTATAASGTSVDVRWTDKSDNDTGFKVERLDANGTPTVLGTTYSNAGLFADANASPNTTYTYRVTALNGTSTSASIVSNAITTPAANAGQLPYNVARTPWTTDATIQGEDFDAGGSTVAYLDSIGGNAGGYYRSGSEDVGYNVDNGRYFLGWNRAGEWVECTINVPTAGTYQFQTSVASDGTGGTFAVAMNGTTKASNVQVPNTGAFTTYQTITTATFTLAAGTNQVLRLTATSDDPTHYWVGDIDWLKLVRVADAPTTMDLTATAVNETTVNLHWNDIYSAETGYTVQGSLDGGTTFADLTVTDVNAEYVAISGLTPGTLYQFRIRATNASDWSNVASATTLATTAVDIGLYSTGFDDNRQPLPGGAVDPHWGGYVVELTRDGEPINPSNAWTLNAGQWIGPVADQSAGDVNDRWFHAKTTFNVPAADVDSLVVYGNALADNELTHFKLNGREITDALNATFTSSKSFTITGGFVAGINTLTADVYNYDALPNAHGLSLALTTSLSQVATPAVVSVKAIDGVAEEGSGTNHATFRIRRTGDTTSALAIPYALWGNADPAADYALTPAGPGDYSTVATITIPAGQGYVDVDLAATADALTEGKETADLTLLGASTFTLDGSQTATATIYDADGTAPVGAPSVSIAVAPVSIAENGTAASVFTVTLDGAEGYAGTIKVPLAVAGTAGERDYAAGAIPEYASFSPVGGGTFGPGPQVVTFSVTPIDDALVEGSETVSVELSEGTGYTLGTTTIATATIVDNDTTPPTNHPPHAVPNAPQPPTTATVGQQYTWDFSQDFADEDAGDVLHYSTPQPSNAAIDANTGVFTWTPTAAELGHRQISLVVDDGHGGTLMPQFGVTVVDASTPLPTVTIVATDPTATEAGPTPGTFTVTRSVVTDQPLTVRYALNPSTSTATPGDDLESLSGTVTILAGNSDATLDVVPIDDATPEPDETVFVDLTPPITGDGYTLGTSTSARVTIVDNDSGTGPSTGTEDVDIDLYEDTDGDGEHDNSDAQETFEGTNQTEIAAEGSEDLSRLELTVRNAATNDTVTIDYDANLYVLYTDSWAQNALTPGTAINLSDLGIDGSGSASLYAQRKPGNSSSAPGTLASSNTSITATVGGKQGKGFKGGTKPGQGADNSEIPDNPEWHDGVTDNNGGLDDGDGDQTLTNRDLFWANPRNSNRTTLIIGFSGHTQSAGKKDVQGKIWDIDPTSGAYQLGLQIYNQNIPITMFPEDPGNKSVLSLDTCGDGVIGVQIRTKAKPASTRMDNSALLPAHFRF